MGYRSEVVFIVAKEVMPQFLVTMAKSPQARAMCFSEADRMIKDYDGDGNILFSWSGIKWYEGYEEIDAIVDFMDWCDGAGGGTTDDGDEWDGEDFYRFVRTGERDDDNVVRGNGWDDVYIERSITF